MDVSDAQTQEAHSCQCCNVLTTCRGCQYSRSEPDGLSRMGVGKYCGDESVVDEKTEFNQPLFGMTIMGVCCQPLSLSVCSNLQPGLLAVRMTGRKQKARHT
jgi:hypothetical protein